VGWLLKNSNWQAETPSAWRDLIVKMEKLRAWWWHRQGLDGSFAGKSAGEVLEATGWVRGLGGVAPYLALFARAGLSREAVDAAVAKLLIHELPAARGCTYVVPAKDFALALAAGAPFEGADMKTAAKLGVTEKEIGKLCEAVVQALSNQPLDPEGIREATGNASRSLGEAGKKKGLTTTLPIAIGILQASGEIRRVATNGRLDQQRYRYALWRPNPLTKFNLSGDQINVELARRFFTWIGPATMAEFQVFSALSGKGARAAMEPLKLASIEGDRFMMPQYRDEFESFKIPRQAQYALLAAIDGLHLFHADVPDLPSHGIYDRGSLVGHWEFDIATDSIVWAASISKNKELEKAVARTEEFVRTQLGDARGYSLDSTKSRAPRIQALRKQMGHE
jgi:Winged helix DNA-binding domain